MRTRDIAEALRSAASSPSVDAGLQAVIGLAMTTGSWTAGSIAVLTPRGSMRNIAYIDGRAAECDRLQTALGRGPAHDAVHDGSVQFSGDLRIDARWGRWPSTAVAAGIVSTLSVRLFTVDTLGTLNLYSAQRREPDADEFDNAELVAAHASVFLAHLSAEQQFVQAIHTGTVIGQAQGILIQRYQLTADMALALLRSISEQRHSEIVDVAAALVATGEFS